MEVGRRELKSSPSGIVGGEGAGIALSVNAGLNGIPPSLPVIYRRFFSAPRTLTCLPSKGRELSILNVAGASSRGTFLRGQFWKKGQLPPWEWSEIPEGKQSGKVPRDYWVPSERLLSSRSFATGAFEKGMSINPHTLTCLWLCCSTFLRKAMALLYSFLEG
ncbi:hypothetical protein CEXT_813851 [Caerostris extrusa]|uniref:Uncharacterized protein n=1 Tax=Caerostris extrusa TaxID=172846 RepID=A0AAV4S023_CAEEX|nr:hypothetical protein CEXT_813851 [Caerostris extrusa]